LKLHSRPKDPLCRPLVAQRNASEGASFVFKVWGVGCGVTWRRD